MSNLRPPWPSAFGRMPPERGSATRASSRASGLTLTHRPDLSLWSNHVTYMTREIVPFIKKLEQAGRRRVLITVNSVPGLSFQRVLYQLVHGEAEEIVPGHVELIN